MRILGIDPGDTTGWATYNTETRSVEAAGQWEECIRQDAANCVPWNLDINRLDIAVVERPRAYGVARPIMVEISIVCGAILGQLRARYATESLLRKSARGRRDSVCDILSDASGCVTVTDDATAWAAVCELHGGADAARKAKRKNKSEVAPAGPLGIAAGSHQKAAVCVAVAWAIKEGIVDYSKVQRAS